MVPALFLMFGAGSGLWMFESELGVGPPVEAGSRVSLELRVETSNGKVITDTELRGLPYETVVGSAEALAFWQPGLSGARVGARRVLFVEPRLAFGATGAQPFVPPGAHLVVWLRVLGIER